MASTLNVQFSDATEATIVAYFYDAQPAGTYSNVGTVASTDARWSTFYAAAGGASLGLAAPGS